MERQEGNEKELLNNIRKSYEEHDIDRAYKLVKELQQIKEIEKREEDRNLCEKIEREYKDMVEFSNPIKDIEWELKDKEGDVKIFTKYLNGEMNVLIESKVDLPGETVLETLVEVNLLSKIIPLVEYSK